MPTINTTDRPSTSMFMGTLVVGDDIQAIRVDATGGGPEQVAIEFTMPDYTALPRIYITEGKARELCDKLTSALATLDQPAPAVKLTSVQS